ncbi:rod shape-determining protein MreC [Candidatus Tisiphia endosymbiont of Nemotelus uliginosus]|uniref:rod shape-determining protein MreC n=1 Tax=Candidatus Tisiphia endosymbiont of Nemotelus uliginosus TaxID=3077926 RepID=UPI0035C90172
MALIENRIKNTNEVSIFIKSIFITLKRLFILFFLILSFYIYISSPQQLTNISLEIVSHCISGIFSVHKALFKKINLLTQNIGYIKNLAKENIDLKLEVARLKHLQNELYMIQAENTELKKLLSVVEEEQYKHIGARLISVSLNPFSKTAVMSAGTKHGVEINQIVTHAEGLVGRVIQVSNNYSKVILINDVNSRIPITTAVSREKGIMSGGTNDGKILYLPKAHLVQKGEKVITSGHGNIYPAGITVGYVNNIKQGDISVQPVVDLSKTEFVNILLPK